MYIENSQRTLIACSGQLKPRNVLHDQYSKSSKQSSRRYVGILSINYPYHGRSLIKKAQTAMINCNLSSTDAVLHKQQFK